MKPEPLKDKKVEYEIDDVKFRVRYGYNEFYTEQDIKSAVEWLINIMKKESEEDNIHLSTRRNVDLEIAIININEAFEDVIEGSGEQPPKEIRVCVCCGEKLIKSEIKGIWICKECCAETGGVKINRSSEPSQSPQEQQKQQQETEIKELVNEVK